MPCLAISLNKISAENCLRGAYHSTSTISHLFVELTIAIRVVLRFSDELDGYREDDQHINNMIRVFEARFLFGTCH